jgi:Zn-dependent metalloprotease
MKKLLLLSLFLTLSQLPSFGQSVAKGEIDAFAAKTGAIPTIDNATASLSFLKFPAGRPLQISGGTPQEKALNFVQQNKALFAMQSGKDNYLVKQSKKDNFGLEHVVLQQYVMGVPVFDGVLKFHFTKTDGLASMNGNFISVAKFNPVPAITKEVAAALALRIVAGQHTKDFKSDLKAPLKVNKNTLYVFQKGLAQGYNGQKHLVYEVEVRNDADVREFLYIDAHTRELVEQFAGMHSIDRKLYETSVAPANLKWTEANGIAGPEFTALDVWQKSEVESAGFMYNLMKNAFGHVSYNGADATMVTVNNDPGISCPNANWNGVTANYCTGVATDDVVAHEWGHAYTEYTSELIYAWQAGAMNEAYSDIWGETVDLLDGYFDADEGTALRATNGTDCPTVATTSRWKLGEQSTSFSGAIRDMYNPNCYNDPGRVSDIKYYCATGLPTGNNDQGGVHINSGVVNHAYALLVDGGTYNEQTITGIGLTKAAHIFWYAQSVYLSKTSDFVALADFLESSAIALTGINLPTLSTGAADLGLSGQIITAADVLELQKVIAAVEFKTEKTCGNPILLQPVAAICAGGTADNALFFADFEAGLGDWTVSSTAGTGSWVPRNWVLKTNAPGNHPGNVVYAENYTGGACATATGQQGLISITSPVISVGTEITGPFTLAFDHYVSIEARWDGGNIRYKIGNGAWILVPPAAFTDNAYNSTVYGSTSNPLTGQRAFTGADGGKVTGSWGQSRINLTSLGFDPGESIQFRWDLGTDECGGWDGWYIDNVRVYSCEPSVPSVQFVTGSTIVNEAEALTANDCLPYVEKIVTVKINKAPSAQVTVTLNPPTGTATLGATADYSFSPNAVILKSGELSKNIVVRIYNDAYVEGPETAVLSYTISGGDGILSSVNQTHTITINDNDFLPIPDPVVLLNADFNNKQKPAGWIGGNAYPDDWAVVSDSDPNVIYLDPNVAGQPFLIAYSEYYGSYYGTTAPHEWSIETAPFSTVGMKSINLSFLEVFKTYTEADDAFDEFASIEAWDGTAWQTIFTENEATGTSGVFGAAVTRNVAIPEGYANAAMKLRFKYTAGWDGYWALDNVKVTGIPVAQIQSAVTTTPDQEYLGPNATAYFYDPTTKNLIAKITNLTSHDYGCTTVEIDRAGADETAWVGTYHITNKTFKVTPTINNPTGSYEITLYYKASELPNFNGADIKSMGKSAGAIGVGNTLGTSYASVQVQDAYSTDYAYTATFNSGFSGFGLSDANPAAGALPVTLTKFEGKNTPEGNRLDWTTTAETNNDYFEVQHARDGRNFLELGKVSGAGNSAVVNNYRFLDSNNPKGISYYKLKQVDKDGKSAFSRVIAIDAANARELKFFPNPVQSSLTLQWPDVSLKTIHVRVINSAGREVLSKKAVKLINGDLTIDVSKLTIGIYQVVLNDGKTSRTVSISKQ